MKAIKTNPQDEAEERNGSKVTKIIDPSQVTSLQ
jgi:hypothetical protein